MKGTKTIGFQIPLVAVNHKIIKWLLDGGLSQESSPFASSSTSSLTLNSKTTTSGGISSNCSDKNRGSTSTRDSLTSSPEDSDSGDESHEIHSDDESSGAIGGPIRKKKTRTVFSRQQVRNFYWPKLKNYSFRLLNWK